MFTVLHVVLFTYLVLRRRMPCRLVLSRSLCQQSVLYTDRPRTLSVLLLHSDTIHLGDVHQTKDHFVLLRSSVSGIKCLMIQQDILLRQGVRTAHYSFTAISTLSLQYYKLDGSKNTSFTLVHMSLVITVCCS